MQRYEAIENGIAKNDIKALREAIGSICYTSRDFSTGEFDEVVKYVETRGIKIKESSLIGNPTISSQKKTFTDEDFAKAVFELKKNFCDERIRDVKTIGKELYGKKAAGGGAVEEKNVSGSAQKNAGKIPNQQSHQKNLGLWIGLVAVIIIILILLVVM